MKRVVAAAACLEYRRDVAYACQRSHALRRFWRSNSWQRACCADESAPKREPPTSLRPSQPACPACSHHAPRRARRLLRYFTGSPAVRSRIVLCAAPRSAMAPQRTTAAPAAPATGTMTVPTGCACDEARSMGRNWGTHWAWTFRRPRACSAAHDVASRFALTRATWCSLQRVRGRCRHERRGGGVRPTQALAAWLPPPACRAEAALRRARAGAAGRSGSRRIGGAVPGGRTVRVAAAAQRRGG